MKYQMRLEALERRLVPDPGKGRKVFRFLDNPEAAKLCYRDNPEALIIHREIVSPKAVDARTG